ncbi:peptidase M23 [Pseudogulbenkiania sp. NH8B]|uniref:peptidoglycan DD-metalloendopeptidase family protein n=1 Tax=Pseudogulbenkiania sp. (strain NH8B) TaxID=748280 RepID=UPI000227A02D|nr:peptidoglycan DD-metalloendopeptidase family protein [Pseudogulbenkiania sp. NH8B]BAK76212.1 peptidase M23 [Pseudogulbenkiania sp. NH8B]
MTNETDFFIFVSTIYGEAAGQSPASWKAIANVITNRIKQGREWKKYKTPVEIIQNTGFDAYTQKNTPYKEAYDYIANGAQTPNAQKIELLKSTVESIFEGGGPDNTNGAVLYYSPKAQEKLYGKPPSWNFDLLEEVKVAGTESDDFKFYKYRAIAKVKIRFLRPDMPLAHREVKAKIGGNEKIVKTNEKGEIPVILTDRIGEELQIWIKNSKGEFSKAYEQTIEALEMAIDIVRNKIVHQTGTDNHVGKPAQHSSSSHTVQPGETLSKIAMRYNISIFELCRVNKIKNQNVISDGQVLELPNGKGAQPRKQSKLLEPNAHQQEARYESHAVRNKNGNPHETVGKTKKDSDVVAKILFPIAGHNRKSYRAGMPGEFGHSRAGRKHAGCDIYASAGTEIRAVADGVVVDKHRFYWHTDQITVDHGGFIVRYGEIDPRSSELKVGEKVKRGQVIARVGQLIMPSGKKYKQCMLHFELYGSSISVAKKPLSNDTPPFKRRDDIVNPTATLDAADD